jgi:murein DD-endopeptidase MepM/ murein hydrolase activator NlpD
MATITQPRTAALFIATLVLVGGGVLGTLWWRQNVPLPSVALDEPVSVLGEQPRMLLHLEAARGNVNGVQVRVIQGAVDTLAFDARFTSDPSPTREVDVEFALRELGLSEGEAMLVFSTSDDFARPRGSEGIALQTPVLIDLTPPPLAVRSSTRYPSPGGTGVAVLFAEDAARVGVQVGERWFRAYPAGPEGLHLAYYALEVGHDPSVVPAAVALDAAGNRSVRELPVVLRSEPVARGSVPLGHDWLRKKLPPLLPSRTDFSDAALAEAFLEVSVGLREQAAEARNRLAAASVPERLWSGSFLQMRNAQVMSRFGVRRTYVLDGEVLDEKEHQGFDLASVAMAEIPAANDGIVVHAGPMTIYGNTVVIDHGQGVLTLYGHCSSIGVAVGDRVQRSQTIARTGATGLAGGDHLHLEVVVGGVPVDPLEWFDPSWIRTHVDEPLAAGGVPAS